jgi:hypothetical protein
MIGGFLSWRGSSHDARRLDHGSILGTSRWSKITACSCDFSAFLALGAAVHLFWGRRSSHGTWACRAREALVRRTGDRLWVIDDRGIVALVSLAAFKSSAEVLSAAQGAGRILALTGS